MIDEYEALYADLIGKTALPMDETQFATRKLSTRTKDKSHGSFPARRYPIYEGQAWQWR
jgi:hypothetical protein